MHSTREKILSKPMTDETTQKPILEITDLSVDFGAGDRAVHAVKSVSFSLNRGETLAIVGESGSGKSVSALSILQLLPYPKASHPSGSILYNGQELIGAPQNVLRKTRGDQIGMIFQEPMTALNPLHTVEKQIGEVLMLHQGLSVSKVREQVLALLHKVRIYRPEDRLTSYPHQLSGGQRQRVMIAMALANTPDVLIADEPTTALDVTVQAEILALLSQLQKEMGMAILLITHDLAMVEKVADRVVVMQQGEVVETGESKALFANPKHPYTNMLLDAAPQPRPASDANKADETAPASIACEDLKVWFPIKKGFFKRTVDHIKAVDGVSLSLCPGRTLGIVGESGSGKTTLALALIRLVKSEGAIHFHGERIDGHDNKAMLTLRQQMQMVFQDPYGSLSPRLTIEQIVAEGLEAHNIGSPEERQQRVIDLLEEVDIDPAARHRYPHEFSGGQRQRIAIARAMIMQPSLLVLDEPTSALDRTVQAQIVDLLAQLQRKHNLAYLFISHDLSVVRALSDDILVLKQGKVIEHGEAQQVFEHPQAEYTQRLIKAAIDFEASADDAGNL
ncbi:MAG: microcin C transport system ATP-binding protein [Saprospiraceae bacterium]|jgi:microcin C transport system ATP-binding protein